jgi:hypothetical protein
MINKNIMSIISSNQNILILNRGSSKRLRGKAREDRAAERTFKRT